MTLLAGVETGHVVHFYDHVDLLALTVGDFLGAGLAEGGTALVVATPEHRAAFVRVLDAAGIDVATARAAGQYAELDAATVLAMIMVDGSPDPSRFEDTIRPLLKTADAGIQPMRVYGELVDLLWREGNADAAHNLEALWNSIGAGRDFALFCGYFSTVVRGTDWRDAIADDHDAVLADHPHRIQDATRHRYEPTLYAVSAARRFVCELLDAWHLSDLRAEAELVISELVTNAVVHTGKRFTVAVAPDGDQGVRIEVSDLSPTPPHIRIETAFATNGRGIPIVSAIAEEWGVDVDAEGKTVWARLMRRAAHG